MNRGAQDSRFLVAVAGTVLSLAASVLPAAAGYTVVEKGTTTTVTQTGTAPLYVVQSPSGEIHVSNGGNASIYPPAKNVVVRGSTEPAPSPVLILLESAVPGTLTLDLPGANDVAVRGPVARMGALTVRGSSDASQVVRLGGLGVPATVERNAKLDLRGGDDALVLEGGTKILGSLVAKGVNRIETGTMLEVGGNLTVNVKRESLGVHFVVSFDERVYVGKSLGVISGPGVDEVDLSGAVGRNVTVDLGDGRDGPQRLYTQLTIGGNLKAGMGTTSHNEILVANWIEGATKITCLGDRNTVFLYAPRAATEARSLAYKGGAGRDDVRMDMRAPRATATLSLGGGDDELELVDVDLARLYVDFGAGTDTLENPDRAPADSTFVNLP